MTTEAASFFLYFGYKISISFVFWFSCALGELLHQFKAKHHHESPPNLMEFRSMFLNRVYLNHILKSNCLKAHHKSRAENNLNYFGLWSPTYGEKGGKNPAQVILTKGKWKLIWWPIHIPICRKQKTKKLPMSSPCLCLLPLSMYLRRPASVVDIRVISDHHYSLVLFSIVTVSLSSSLLVLLCKHDWRLRIPIRDTNC